RSSKPRDVHNAARAQRRLNPYWRAFSSRESRERHSVETDAAPSLTFQIGVPDLASFPYELWRRLSMRTLRRFRARPALVADPQGEAWLREAIARHVSFARAVACNPQDIIVTAGAQQAFDLLARVLARLERAPVALENPGYPPLLAAFASHGSRIALVSVDEEGMLVERLPRGARVVCVTPSHQFPLGVVMSAQRRLALLEFCRRRGAVVIEDDYDAEFRFSDRPLDALQTLDRAECVFYVGTFSKSLMPDLRLGYIVAPPWALAPLVAAKRIADGQCSVLAQSTLALLISEGHLARHVRRMQRIYRARRDLLLHELRSRFERWFQVLPSVAGLHLTVQLDRAYEEDRVIESAIRQGVRVAPLRRFYPGAPTMRGLVLGYGNIDERGIEEGLDRLHRSLLGA
ncbi:MAG TPA: PLP-dependent aminotransferase family protein, partial [Steroidobacteraceae bacterium]|nr:PLP-dependent aminotransferase family protein [Steroidobacteraceae bacterium]